MKPEDSIICLCCRQRFNHVHRQALEQFGRSTRLDWDYIFATSYKRNQVAPLVFLNLAKSEETGLSIPESVREQFEQATVLNIKVKQRTSIALGQVLDLFARKGINLMLVKGAALNQIVYEKPWYTLSHDVDLVIQPRREELAASDLREISETLEGLNGAPREVREHIEYDFYAHHDVTMNGVVAMDPDRLWREARKHRLGAHDVYLMAPEDMLLTTAVQCCRKRFFKLKNLVDMAEFLAVCADLDWDGVIAKARDYRCNILLYTALVVCQMVIGCKLPPGILDRLDVNPVRRRLIHQIASTLLRRHSLAELRAVSSKVVLGRPYSPTLSLTYATYRLDQLAPKLGEIRQGYALSKPESQAQF